MGLFTIKFCSILLLSFATLQCSGQNKHHKKELEIEKQTENKQDMEGKKVLYDFSVNDINGNNFRLDSLRGKKVLIVNVASKCGLTPQYKELQELYDKYKDMNFVIIGFPANNFLGQEPGSNQEIKEFCTVNYGVTFPMMEKISVKGKDQAPLYRWLTKKSENGVLDQKVTWNFQKYLINEEGQLVDVVMPKESPLSNKIVDWITKN